MKDVFLTVSAMRVKSISFDFDNDDSFKIRDIGVNIVLLNPQGKEVTTMNIHSQTYFSTTFPEDLTYLHPQIAVLARELETKASIAVNGLAKMIPPTTTKQTNYNSDITKED